MFRAHRIVLFHPWCVQCVRVWCLYITSSLIGYTDLLYKMQTVGAGALGDMLRSSLPMSRYDRMTFSSAAAHTYVHD